MGLPRRAGPLILGVLFSATALLGGVAFMGLLPAIILGSLAFGGLAFGLGLFATATAVVLPSMLAVVRARLAWRTWMLYTSMYESRLFVCCLHSSVLDAARAPH